MSEQMSTSGCPPPANAPSSPRVRKSGQGLIGGVVLAADDRGLVIKAPDGSLWLAAACCSCWSGCWWVNITPANSPSLSPAERELLKEATSKWHT
jgi:hypothetical protein